MKEQTITGKSGPLCSLGSLLLLTAIFLGNVAPAERWLGDTPYIINEVLFRIYGLMFAAGALGILAGVAGIYAAISHVSGPASLAGKLGTGLSGLGIAVVAVMGLVQAVLARRIDSFANLALYALMAGMLLLGVVCAVHLRGTVLRILVPMIGIWPLLWVAAQTIADRLRLDGVWSVMGLSYILLWLLAGVFLWLRRPATQLLPQPAST